MFKILFGSPRWNLQLMIVGSGALAYQSPWPYRLGFIIVLAAAAALLVVIIAIDLQDDKRRRRPGRRR